jgi:hypothetical protein
MRTITLREYVLEQFNQMLAENGENVRVVIDRPRPVLATTDGDVVLLPQQQKEGADG